MTDVDRLLHEIAEGKWQLVLLKRKLEEMQRTCTHDYIEEKAYRICQQCKHMESIHY